MFKPELTPKIASMMATVGFYEHTGDWLFTTGLPAKTGVGGGIMGVVPGVMGVAAFAPPLDPFVKDTMTFPFQISILYLFVV